MKRCPLCRVVILPNKVHPADCRTDGRFWSNAFVYWTRNAQPILVRKSKSDDIFIGVPLDAKLVLLVTPKEAMEGLTDAIEAAHTRTMYDSPLPKSLVRYFTHQTYRVHALDGQMRARAVWNDPSYTPLHLVSLSLSGIDDPAIDWATSKLLRFDTVSRAKYGDVTLTLGDEPPAPRGFAQDPYGGAPVSFSLVTERNKKTNAK